MKIFFYVLCFKGCEKKWEENFAAVGVRLILISNGLPDCFVSN